MRNRVRCASTARHEFRSPSAQLVDCRERAHIGVELRAVQLVGVVIAASSDRMSIPFRQFNCLYWTGRLTTCQGTNHAPIC